VARLLNEAKLATLLIDLLTLDEEAIDARTAHLRFDIDLLAEKARGIWGTRRSGAVGARVVPPPSYPWLFERTRCNAGRTERLKSGARRRKALDVEASASVFQNYHLESQSAGVFGGP